MAQSGGALIRAYLGAQATVSLPFTERFRVICIEEMGPVSAKTYPGAVWKEADGMRATYDADWGLRGKTWVFGAFEPATGKAVTWCSPHRDSAGFGALLDQVIREYPANGWIRASRHRVAILGQPERPLFEGKPAGAGGAYGNALDSGVADTQIRGVAEPD